jgi:hypothetical protein
MIPRSVELLGAVQEELESLLTRIKDTSSQDAGFKDLVTETSVLFSEYKGLTRENFVATDLGRWVFRYAWSNILYLGWFVT